MAAAAVATAARSSSSSGGGGGAVVERSNKRPRPPLDITAASGELPLPPVTATPALLPAAAAADALVARVEACLKDATRGFPWFRAAVAAWLVHEPGGLLLPPPPPPPVRPLAQTRASDGSAPRDSGGSSGAADARTDPAAPPPPLVPLSVEAVTALIHAWAPTLLRLTRAHPPFAPLLLSLLLARLEAAATAPAPTATEAGGRGDRAGAAASAVGQAGNGEHGVGVRAMAWVSFLVSRHWAAFAGQHAVRGGGSVSRAGAGDWSLAVVPPPSPLAPPAPASPTHPAAPVSPSASYAFILDRAPWRAAQAAWMAAPAPLASLAGLTQEVGAAAQPPPSGAGRGSVRGSVSDGGRQFGPPRLAALDCALLAPLLAAVSRWLARPALARTASLAQLLRLAAECGVDVDAVRADVAATLLALTAAQAGGEGEPQRQQQPLVGGAAAVGGSWEAAAAPPVAAAASAPAAEAAGAGELLDLDALEALLLGGGGGGGGGGGDAAEAGAAVVAAAADSPPRGQMPPLPPPPSDPAAGAAALPPRRRPRWALAAGGLVVNG